MTVAAKADSGHSPMTQPGRLLLWPAIALLVSLQLWLIVAHAPWRDELQAYLLVRDSPGLEGLFANLRYEGHPSLWYLLLGVAEAVIPSPRALTLLQLAVALGTTALVWLRAPFAPGIRLLILAGYFPLFEYGVIARSYGLGAMLLFAWLAARRTPWRWLILALMANVAVHFALLSAFCVAADLWIARRWSWAGGALWAAGGLAALITILPPHDLQTGSAWLAHPLGERLIDALQRGSSVILPALPRPFRWQMLLALPAGAAIGLLAWVVSVLAVRRDPRAGALMFGLFLALIGMSALLYPTYPRHIGVVVLLAIALEWLRRERGDRVSAPAFVGWIGLNAFCGLWAAGWALWVPFSPGPQEARWIAERHLQSAHWAAYPGYVGSDIAAYFDRPVYNLQKLCLNSFIRWNTHAYDDLSDADLAARIAQPGPFSYLVAEDDLKRLKAPLRLLARFDHGLGDKDVFLYAVERPQVGTARHCP